jgi:hypothetical protein
MTVNVTKPAINLREKLSELQNTVEYSQQQFWFEGEGSGDDYEVTFNGFTYTVSFNTAPGSGNDIGVIAVRA